MQMIPMNGPLLLKPQIGDVTLFVHFHKLWLVEEKPEIEADEENGIEYQAGVQRVPACEVYFGFMKDGKFVVERSSNFKERIDELAQKRFLQNLQRYLDEGYNKDWNSYKLDEPVTQTIMAIKKTNQDLCQQQWDLLEELKRMLKHMMLKPSHVVKASNSPTTPNP
jgi:hypothetical protein